MAVDADPAETRVPEHSDVDGVNVVAASWRTDLLRYRWPEWDALDADAKLALLREAAPPPDEYGRTHNVTTDTFHSYLAATIDPETTTVSRTPDRLLLGSDGSGGGDGTFSSSDDAMDSPEGSVAITDTIYDGSAGETTFTTFVDSSQLNGSTLAECGLETTGGLLWNHAPVSPNIDKTNAKTAIIEVVIGFSN